jgi:stearoyl-CoA desaturase (delta-9 desaturase)
MCISYCRSLKPADNRIMSIITMGEGSHNYHHAFPWDYRTAELPLWGFDWTRNIIELFAWIGWAYDLKTASEELIRKRAMRTGDGTHPSAAAAKD